jgi:transcriptional regulator with XRE-family HTH domain
MLPHRLKEARLRTGLSQQKLGILAGIDEATASARMNQYERGIHTLTSRWPVGWQKC